MDNNSISYAMIGKPAVGTRTLKVAKGAFNHEFDIDALRDVWYKTSYLLDRDQSMNGCATHAMTTIRNSRWR